MPSHLTIVRASVAIFVAAATPAGAQTDSAQPPHLPPGQLVDIGGWRLHLHCTGGAGPTRPTVILEPGVGDFSVEWSLVQPRVATFARVCSYDRAGDGWSDLGPHPRTMGQQVHELRTLLEKAGVPPPYVLVGQSYGGVLVRVYTARYPSDVAGIVLVDGGRLDPMRFIDGRLVRLPETATGRPVPPPKTSNPLRESDIPAGARAQIEAGARQAVPRANEPPRDRLPAEAQGMRTWALGQIKHYAAYVNPFEAEELALMIADQKTSEFPLGNRPLIVLTGGLRQYDDPALDDDRRRSHASIAALSRAGKQVIAERSGHHIHIDDPDLVVRSIREVLAATRGGRLR